jgi:protein SCO1/2
VGVVGCGQTSDAANQSDAPQKDFRGAVIAPPRAVTDFTLPSTTGEDFTLSQQQGKVVLLYFGYLTCPDVCPTTMADLLRAYRELGEPTEQVQVVFVTVDPERDTLDRLAVYMKAFHEDFIAVRPESPEAVQTLAAAYGITVERREVDSALGYLMDHSALVLAINPQGKLVEQFLFGTPYEDIAHDVKLLMG